MALVALSWGNSLRAFQKAIKEIEKKSQKEIETIVNDTGKVVFKTVKRFTPKRSGRLRRSWKKRGTGRGPERKVYITNKVPYGPLVEYGSRNRKPVRMLSRALYVGNRYMRKRLNAYKRKING